MNTEQDYDGLPDAARKQLDAIKLARKPAEQPAVTLEPQPATPAQELEPTPPAADPATPVELPAANPATGEPTAEGRVDWKQKYLSLQGRIETVSAQLAAVRNNEKYLKTVIADLQDKLASRQAPSSATGGAPVATPEILSDEERKEYGPKFEGTAQKIADRAAAQARADTLKEVDSRIKDVEEKAQAAVMQLFFRDLTKALPHWRAINASQPFKAWLLEYDTFVDADGTPSVEKRDDVLQRRAAAGDVEGAVQLFKMFVDTTGLFRVPAAPAAKPASAIPKQEELVSPKPSGGTPAGAPQEERLTETGFRKFQEDLKKGKFSNRPDFAEKRLKQFMDAMRAGRLVAD